VKGKDSLILVWASVDPYLFSDPESRQNPFLLGLPVHSLRSGTPEPAANVSFVIDSSNEYLYFFSLSLCRVLLFINSGCFFSMMHHMKEGVRWLLRKKDAALIQKGADVFRLIRLQMTVPSAQ
jgi:hypothetical protein